MVRSYLKAAHAVQKRLDVFMWDFDLRELNGYDLRRDPLNVDKGVDSRRSAAFRITMRACCFVLRSRQFLPASTTHAGSILRVTTGVSSDLVKAVD